MGTHKADRQTICMHGRLRGKDIVCPYRSVSPWDGTMSKCPAERMQAGLAVSKREDGKWDSLDFCSVFGLPLLRCPGDFCARHGILPWMHDPGGKPEGPGPG